MTVLNIGDMTMKKRNSLSDMTLQMLCEMNAKAEHLVKLMKQGIVEFIFKKMSTGKERKAHGTLRRDLIPPEFQRKRGRPKKRPSYLVIYYDTDKKDIRSFKDELLKRIISKPKKSVHSINKKDIKKDEIKQDEKSSKSNKEDRNI